MTIEEHIENLKAMASDMPSDKCSDWIESLMAGINAMEELQAHREAWEKMETALNAMTNRYYVTRFDYAIEEAIDVVKEYRPREGESNDSSNN